MAGAALTFEVLYLVLALIWPSTKRLRARGDSGFRRGAGLSGRAAVAALFAGLCLAPILDLGAALPRLGQVTATAVLGVALTVAGLTGVVSAQRAMGESWRVGVDPAERTQLVTTGVFRLVRNPIYTSMLVFAVGIALLVPNIAAIAGLLTTCAALNWHVRRIEEPNLLEHHRDEFSAYAAAVGRFLPRIGRLRTVQSQ